MTQYISKDSLVAEIEILKVDALQKKGQCKRRGLERIMNQICAYNKIISLLDTLEVKEVDLEKEIELVKGDYEQVNVAWNNDFDFIAKHFFELGLNIQQNISINVINIDKVIEKNGVDPNSKEAKMFKESYYMALEKLKAKKGE